MRKCGVTRTIKKRWNNIKKVFSTDTTGHDWSHIERVVNTTKTPVKAEGRFYLSAAAALLHDVIDDKIVRNQHVLKELKISVSLK